MATARRQAIAAASFRWAVALLGAKNGSNRVFRTPEYYLFGGQYRICVFLNGQRLAGDGGDFTESESGGFGSGFDTLTLEVAPQADDVLMADYIAA